MKSSLPVIDILVGATRYREKWCHQLGLLVSRISSLYDQLTIHPNVESTRLSINIGFGRVH